MSNDALGPAPRPEPAASEYMQAAPGWYADNNARVQRYWDGARWTGHMAPLPEASSQHVYLHHDVQARNPMATAGLVLGIISLVLNFIGVPAALAIIFSGVGLARANYIGVGRGSAWAGLIMGSISFIVGWAVLNAALGNS